MKAIKVLVIEDEILICETIRLYLNERGHILLNSAISYDEGIALFHKDVPDLVLLDVRLYGQKSGIDFANYLYSLPTLVPYIFLTSQFDKKIVEEALNTAPGGYLTKPIQKESLWTTIESVFSCHVKNKSNEPSMLSISDGHTTHVINECDILYIQAEHVYVNIILKNEKSILTRLSLTEIMKKLNCNFFFQCHRSYIINHNFITSWNSAGLFINKYFIPVSRSRKKEIFSKLNSKLKN